MGKKEKKAWRKEWLTWGTEACWIADEYALDVEINRTLLHMLHTRKVAKPKKAKRIYKELLAQRTAEAFIHTPDPERPVHFVTPRSLAVRPAPNKKEN
jgi:hypothetical protein